MSSLLATVAPQPEFGVQPTERPGLDRTLEQVIVHAWDEVSSGARVECPVCGADMEPEYGQHARAVAGRCSGCGATLS